MKPIVFEWQFHPHFSHFDMYGHVNTHHLVEYVIESRHAFFHDRFKKSAKDFVTLGYSVQTVRMSFNFRRGVTGFGAISVESFVDKSIGPIIRVPFKVLDGARNVLLDGVLEQAFVDLTTNAAMVKMPEEAIQYFYE